MCGSSLTTKERIVLKRLNFACLAGVLVLGACSDDESPPVTELLEACTVTSTGGYFLSRGFYTDSFPGSRLAQVVIQFSADGAGDYTIRLTVRQDAYNGPVLGTAQTTVALTANATEYFPGTFDFDHIAVPRGGIVTLDFEELAGPGGTPFTRGEDVPTCSFERTSDKAPPLSTDHGNNPHNAVSGTP
jgi:hypothetical protein